MTTRAWFGCLGLAQFVAWPSPGMAAPQATGLEAVYERIENVPNLTLAEKYEQKMQVLGATLEAGDAYTSAFEDLVSYTRIARETGGLFLPGFGKQLQEFEKRLEAATDNRVFKAFGQVKTAGDYVSKAVGLVSAVDEITKDKNLTPASRRSLAALRILGETMQSFGGKVPGLGAGLEMYGQLVTELTGAVRQTAANIASLQGHRLQPEVQRQLGLDDRYMRTPLYDQELPIVQEVIREGDAERTLLQTADRGWIEVSYDEVTAIWCEFKYVNGTAPTAAEVAGYLDSPDERARLSQRARIRAETARAEELKQELEVTGVSTTAVQRAERELQTALRRLGVLVPPTSYAYRTLLKNQLQNPGENEARLRGLALAANVGAREYFTWRGVDPDRLSIEDLTSQLIDYRVRGYREYAAHLRALEAATRPQPAAPASTVLDRAIEKVKAERTGGTTAPSEHPAVPPPPRTSDDACVRAAGQPLEAGRRAFEGWKTESRGKTWGPFVCGPDPWVPCMPSSYAEVWKAVDGSVPKDQWGRESPPGCSFVDLTNTAYNDCVWAAYLKKLEALVAAEIATCPKQDVP